MPDLQSSLHAADGSPVRVLVLAGAPDRLEMRSRFLDLLATTGHAPAPVLVDLREAALPDEADRVFLACIVVALLPECRVALLARKEAINHVTEGVAVRAGAMVRTFWREEAARDWLQGRQSVPPATGV